jgi:hypothetical protein
MKLPDFELKAEFNELRRAMGAQQLGDLRLKQAQNLITEAELEALAGIGIDVQWDDVRVLDDGTLAYKDRRVVLYIRDVSLYGNKTIHDVMPKFHIAQCRTLDDMQAKGRGQRYVVATRTTGDFSINVIRKGHAINQRDHRLSVCQNCLERLRFDSFRIDLARETRLSHVARFSLDKFFEQYPLKILDESGHESEATAPLNEYPADFELIARKIKAQRHYRCEQCGWFPADDYERRFIHLHHKNGQKFDSRLTNFSVLCIGCHADQPLHGHLRQSPDYDAFVYHKGKKR